MLFPPPWAVLVRQNQQNVCFPSKGWLSWHTGSISRGTLRQQSATACSCGDRSLITQVCCCSCRPSTSNAEDLTGEVWGCLTQCTLCSDVEVQGMMGPLSLSEHKAGLGILTMQHLNYLLEMCFFSVPCESNSLFMVVVILLYRFLSIISVCSLPEVYSKFIQFYCIAILLSNTSLGELPLHSLLLQVCLC